MSRKLKTDFEIINKLAAFDDEAYLMLENIDKKYKHNRIQFVKNALNDAESLLIEAIYTPPLTLEMGREKTKLLSKSLAKVVSAEYQVYRMCDKTSSLTKIGKSRFMDGLYDLYKDYDKLLNSLKKKYGADVNGYGRCAELGTIRTADCRKEGGSYGQ